MDISVLSTYANDVLLRENGEIIAQQKGGPILYIESALKDSGVPYKLYFGETLTVEILIKDGKEFGRIPQKPESKEVPSDISDWVIVSTLLQEWNLQAIKGSKKKFFVDLQGYVRKGDDFGEKRVWEEVCEFDESIFCMKGTREEVSYVPKSSLEKQKERMLIITDGEDGGEIFYNGINKKFPLKDKIHPKDTIGAGDTFFSYFVAALYNGKDPFESMESAQLETVVFLKKKN